MAYERQIDVGDLPPHLAALLATLPVNVNRRAAAKLLEQYFFKASHRSLERWPLPWRHVNAQAITPTAALFREAHARLTAAPEIMGGRGRKAA